MQGVELADFLVMGKSETTWSLAAGEEAKARIA
jgi:hypothetical protein